MEAPVIQEMTDACLDMGGLFANVIIHHVTPICSGRLPLCNVWLGADVRVVDGCQRCAFERAGGGDLNLLLHLLWTESAAPV